MFLQTAGLAAGYAWIAPNGLARRSPVQIGAISYSFRELPTSAEQVLGYMQELGLTTIELMGGVAEEYAGAPIGPPRRHPESMSADERLVYIQAQRQAQIAVKEWRLTAPMDKMKELGEMYRDGGVEIDILKLGRPGWPVGEINYAFKAAKAMGARGISFEISDAGAERMAPFATEHEMVASMHNHTQVAREGFTWEKPLSFSPYNMLNLDIGHYVAGLGTSPIPVIEKYHDRITHLHLKDRQAPENGALNVPWGEGDTPIAEVLRLLRDRRYPITAMIELEHPIPGGSSVMAEMHRCVQYCRAALEA